MSVLRLLVAVAVLVAPVSASAQQVGLLRLQNGRVSMDVRDVPLARILSEWARIGDVTILNGEQLKGPPVTLQLTDVPERHALDILLRGAAGYMLGPRALGTSGASMYDRILILATSSAPRNPAPPAAAPQAPRYVPTQADNGPNNPPEPTSAIGSIRRFSPVIRPPVPAATTPQDTPQDAGPIPPPAPPVTSANPFGVPAGSGLPGVITPPPPAPPQQAPTRR